MPLSEYRIGKKMMGCWFELLTVDSDEVKALTALEQGIAEIERIETLLSEFIPGSQTSLLNLAAGKQGVKVDEEVYHLVQRAINISQLTQGAFDITAGTLKKLYHFNKGQDLFPNQHQVNRALSKTGFHHIKLREDREIFLEKEGMNISFAAIGKGYAADCVIRRWKKEGIAGGVVNASGDLTLFGNRADGSAWNVGVAHPDQRHQMLFWLPLCDGAVATSGDYEQYFMHERKRYSHNINPRTGMPLSGIKSVTVTGSSAELCDALCTAIYVMNTEVGLHFIDQLPGMHCLIIDDMNRVHHSSNLQLSYA